MPEAAARHRNRAFDEWQDFRNTEKDAGAELGIEPPRGFAPIYGFDIARALVVSLATASDRSQQLSRRRDAMVGFAGGFVGGLTAMPGALPTIWCDLRGLPKDQQRGLVQPFIAAMQLLALLLMISRRTIPTGMLEDFVISLPALLAGTVAGIAMFGRVNESAFRRVVLAVLLVAGLVLLM